MRKPLSAVIVLMLLFAGLGSSAVLTRAFGGPKSLTAIQQEKRLGPKPIPRWYWRWQAWRLGEGYAKGHPRQPNLRPRHAPQRIPTWAWRRMHFFLLARVDRPLVYIERKRHEPSKTTTETTSTATTNSTTMNTTTMNTTTTTTTSSGSVAPPSFVGDFESGLTPWKSTGGGAQCANYGMPSGSGGHYRGDFYLDSSNPGQGSTSGRFDLPAQSTYPLEVCDVITGPLKNTVGTDGYYGLMVLAPAGYNYPGFGDLIEGLHFVNVYTAPINLVLHTGHLALNLETGPCLTNGCAYRNGPACTPSSSVTCLPPKDVIPSFSGGHWYEFITHVHWASDSSGLIETWYRLKGSSTWTASASYSGIPTEQWKAGTSCCTTYYDDEIASYTPALSTPLSIWLDNQTTGPTFSAVAATMP